MSTFARLSFGGRLLVWATFSVAVAAAIVVVWQASHSSPGRGDSRPACALAASGTKLCGGDLAAYCREFVRGSLDQGTVMACSSVGVDVVK